MTGRHAFRSLSMLSFINISSYHAPASNGIYPSCQLDLVSRCRSRPRRTFCFDHLCDLPSQVQEIILFSDIKKPFENELQTAWLRAPSHPILSR